MNKVLLAVIAMLFALTAVPVAYAEYVDEAVTEAATEAETEVTTDEALSAEVPAIVDTAASDESSSE